MHACRVLSFAAVALVLGNLFTGGNAVVGSRCVTGL